MAHLSDRHCVPSEILDDLSSRFIVNIPEEERREPTRLCFQVELAYWFYLDFFCTEDPSLKTCGMKDFTAQIFEHIPFLTPLLKNLDKILEDWRIYKSSVPTYGAIILNEDLTKVLLVQSYFTRSSWGFPKGKVNELETPSNCAVREVYEETGLDISKIIDEDDYMEANINEQTVRLYIVSGVNVNVKLEPKTRNEIKNLEWFVVNDLPTNKKDMTSKLKFGVGPNTFFMILPFVRKIRNWIRKKKQEGKPVNKQEGKPVNKQEGKPVNKQEGKSVNKQEEKSVNKVENGRRQRHKSVGELPTNSAPLQPMQNKKNKKQSNQPLQNDVQVNAIVKNPSVPKINKPCKQEKKSNVNRQLFNDDKNQQSVHKQNINDLSAGIEDSDLKENMNHNECLFIIPRWLNFKLDRTSILKCFDD